MRVLMLGWEFPPHMSGGLGTACYGMTKALAEKGAEIIFVLPRFNVKGDMPTSPGNRLHLVSASGTSVSSTLLHKRMSTQARDLWEEKLIVRSVDALLFPYATEESYLEHLRNMEKYSGQEHSEHTSTTANTTVLQLQGGYGPDLMSEVYRYSQAAAAIALREKFDVIHAHDWMTYPAGMLIKKLTGKPLVTHIHAMEHDRSGKNLNAEVSHIEWAGMSAADVVVAVSHYTKSQVMLHYGIPEERIEVVHNAVTRSEASRHFPLPYRCSQEKRVLFMGRVTYQKGPDYFVEAARMVLERLPNTRFIMAGSGDMLTRMVRRVAQLRMGSRFHFTGFLKGKDVDRMYAISDLYVMPSVSEPFGIAPLEAMVYDTPVLISRQSGVSEVVRNALKVDFWDTREMANMICAALTYPRLATEMIKNCREELKTIRWANAANRLLTIYTNALSNHA